MQLHLGVLDIPYNQAPPPRQRKPRASMVTTGDVATFLENRYHVMEVFYLENQGEVARMLESSLSGALESFLMGAPVSLDAFGAATSAIETRFKKFLSDAEMEKLGYPGVPTQAALRGVSHRRKRPYVKTNPRRVSFVDTGLYSASMRAWID